jgi:hypothetical protein
MSNFWDVEIRDQFILGFGLGFLPASNVGQRVHARPDVEGDEAAVFAEQNVGATSETRSPFHPTFYKQ